MRTLLVSLSAPLFALACLTGCGDDTSSGTGGAGGASGQGGATATGSPSGSGGGNGGSTGAGTNGTSTNGSTGSMPDTVGSSGDTSSSTGAGGDVEPPGMEGMTAAHNAARASVDPPAASPIPPLSWDGTIGATAQSYADNCVFEHSGNQYGENLFASAGQSPSPADVVGSWVEEAAFYDYDANSCSDVCGHYTQVVWADSLRLGCGHTTCNTNSPFGADFPTWDLWVCNYDPPGNFNGERPY